MLFVWILLLLVTNRSYSYRLLVVMDEFNYAYNERNIIDSISNINSTIMDGKLSFEIIQTWKTTDTKLFLDKLCQEMMKGLTAIFDFSDQLISEAVLSVANASGIAYISSFNSALEPDIPLEMAINIQPIEVTLMRVIRSIVSMENLTNAAILYDRTIIDMDKIPKTLLHNLPCQHLYQELKSEKDFDSQLDVLKMNDLDQIFIMASPKLTSVLLTKAKQKAMISFKYNYYALTLTIPTCNQCNESYVNMEPVLNENSLKSYKLFDSSNFIDLKRAFVFDMFSLFGTVLKSIAGQFGNEVSFNDCTKEFNRDQEAFKKAELLINNIKLKTWYGVTGEFKSEIGNEDKAIVQNAELNIKRDGKVVGEWSKKNGLRTADNQLISNNNMKKVYRVVTVVEPPFVIQSSTLPTAETGVKNYYYNKETGLYYFGYCIDLLQHIKEKLDFEYELYESIDGKYGNQNEKNKWNGMVGQLVDNKADIIVAAMSVMAERENVIDFTVPYYDLVGITILMKKPKFEYSVFKFLNVLEGAVWGCIFSAFVIVSILLCIFDRYSPYSYQNNKQVWDGSGDEPRIFSLKEGLWFCMTSLTPQGGGEAPRALSGRLVAATWWMFGFIMIATYTANLAAFLTVSRLDQPISSLDDLAKQFKVKYAPQEATSSQTYFHRMADIENKFYSIWKDMSLNDSLDIIERAKLAVWDYPVSDKFTNMWQAMTDSGFPVNLEAAKLRIKEPPNGEEFAFIGDATQNKYATNIDCDLWEVGEEFSRKPYALAVQEGSPLKNQLSSVILQLLNQRILEDLKTNWWEYGKVQCEKIEDESGGISIKNIGGVFLVIFIGITLGLITLAFEYYWYKIRPAIAEKRKKKREMIASNVTSNNPVRETTSVYFANGGFNADNN